MAGLPWTAWLLLGLGVAPGLWLVLRARARFYRKRRENDRHG